MGNVVSVQGTLLAGPPKASCNKFPSGLVNAAFELTPPNKAADVACYQSRNLVSVGTYLTMDGVGTTVTRGTFLYVRTTTKLLVRITTVGDAGNVVSELYVQGLYMQEFPAGNYLTKLESQGVGVIEYFASGNQ